MKIDAHQVGISQGELVLFSDFQEDGVMWSGEGPRELRRKITFPDPYTAPPAVHVTLAMWDIDNTHNSRVDISAGDITTEGFVIIFKTWADSRVARVRAGWMAIGPVKHDDDWDLY
ncbi:hypothetical protein ERN12_06340 [Rhodobacteraceae bacterium]|nr:hypothetical protein ERN12_06340 [Paracoccaceae bacterium]